MYTTYSTMLTFVTEMYKVRMKTFHGYLWSDDITFGRTFDWRRRIVPNTHDICISLSEIKLIKPNRALSTSYAFECLREFPLLGCMCYVSLSFCVERNVHERGVQLKRRVHAKFALFA